MNNQEISEKFKEVDVKLDKHGDAIEDLKTKSAVSIERIDNLCKSLDTLCSKL